MSVHTQSIPQRQTIHVAPDTNTHIAPAPRPAAGRVAAFVLAGGAGTRLGALTDERPKPLLPLASHRLIDFTLSNCANSELDDVYVLAQYKADHIERYLGDGESWGFGDKKRLSLLTAGPNASYAGTADAVRQHIDAATFARAERFVVLAADHVYRMDYQSLLDEHERLSADVTVGTVTVPRVDASQFGIVETDARGWVQRFEEKPIAPSSNQASMGIYVFGASQLRRLLEVRPGGAAVVDFGYDVLPLALQLGMRVAAYEFGGHWRDVGTPESYLEAHRDIIQNREGFPLPNQRWPIATADLPAGDLEIAESALVRRSLVIGGATVRGVLVDSTVMAGVRVEEGAIIRDSVLLHGVHVERGAVVERAVIDRDARVRPYARIGLSRAYPVTLVPARAVVEPARVRVRHAVQRGNRAVIA